MALPVSKKISDISTILEVTASAAQSPGDVLTAYGGSAGVVLGCENIANAERMSLALDGIWEIDCASGTTASAGDDAFFNTSTEQIVTAGGSSIIWVGKFAKAKTSGQTKAAVELNAGLGVSTGPYIPAAAQQALSGAGAITVTEYYTAWTTTGADAGTLADGVRVGQLKKVQLIVDGGDGTLTPSNLSGGTTITFADAGDYAVLQWDGSNWLAIELGNDADGATAPVLA